MMMHLDCWDNTNNCFSFPVYIYINISARAGPEDSDTITEWLRMERPLEAVLSNLSAEAEPPKAACLGPWLEVSEYLQGVTPQNHTPHAGQGTAHQLSSPHCSLTHS